MKKKGRRECFILNDFEETHSKAFELLLPLYSFCCYFCCNCCCYCIHNTSSKAITEITRCTFLLVLLMVLATTQEAKKKHRTRKEKEKKNKSEENFRKE